MEWISVNKELPTNSNCFVFCIIAKENKVVMEALFNGKTKRFQNRNFSELKHKVTDWMPLPEPPK